MNLIDNYMDLFVYTNRVMTLIKLYSMQLWDKCHSFCKERDNS